MTDTSTRLRQAEAMTPEDVVRLEDERDALAAKVRDHDEAYGYLSRLFVSVAPQCTPLGDLLGIVTQIDNAMVWLQERTTAAEVDVATLRAALQAAKAETEGATELLRLATADRNNLFTLIIALRNAGNDLAALCVGEMGDTINVQRWISAEARAAEEGK